MRNLLFFLAFLALLVGTAPVHAKTGGEVIPPYQGTDFTIGTAGCSGGKVLGWTGTSVACINPTPGVSTGACPTGQVMTKISGQTPTCKYPVNAVCEEGQAIQILGPNSLKCIDVGGTTEMDIDCRTAGYALRAVGVNGAVTCIDVSSLTAMCPEGSILTGIRNGQPICQAPAVIEGDYSCPKVGADGNGIREINEHGHLNCEHLRSTHVSCPPGYAINKISNEKLTCVFMNGTPLGGVSWGSNGRCPSGTGAVGANSDGSGAVLCRQYLAAGSVTLP